MNCVIKFSSKNSNGNLICGNLLWMPPYLYPECDLENGINLLKRKKYWVSRFPEGDGLTFNLQDSIEEDLKDFELAFPWMNLRVYKKDEELNFDEHLTSEQIVILPVSRLEIHESIYSKEICLFPPGEFQIQKVNLKNIYGGDLVSFDKEDLSGANKLQRKSLRDHITLTTGVKKEVFFDFPLIVFRDKISVKDYLSLNQKEDVGLIKVFSQKADKILDIIKFFSCNYTNPELLPARAGLWDDRYSVAMVHFPVFNVAFFQSREVEIKTLIVGIGTEFGGTSIINDLNVFTKSEDELGEVGKLVKYALRLNSNIAEADNDSLKFMQIMTLMEFLGNPFEYENFKKTKGKIITYIADNKTDYHNLSEKFRFLSEEVRTQIIHNGKSLEDLIRNEEERQDLFKFFKNIVNNIIEDFIEYSHLTWEEYNIIRKTRQSFFI